MPNAHLSPTFAGVRKAGGSMRGAVLDLADFGCAMRRHVPHEPKLRGVLGWAVVSDRPNAEPWAHLDLDGLRTLLARRDY